MICVIIKKYTKEKNDFIDTYIPSSNSINFQNRKNIENMKQNRD